MGGYGFFILMVTPFDYVKYNFRWDHGCGTFTQVPFKESMIDHLEIESTIIFADSKEGQEQIKKYGRDDIKPGSL